MAPRALPDLWLILHYCALIGFRPVIPDIDIWRAATLMLKRYGERPQRERCARRPARNRRRSQRRDDLAPHYRCRRAARKYDTDRPGALSKQGRDRQISHTEIFPKAWLRLTDGLRVGAEPARSAALSRD